MICRAGSIWQSEWSRYKREYPYNSSERKNSYYRQSLSELKLQKILPGVMDVFEELKSRGIKVAIGSSSKNASYIPNRIGLSSFFNVVADRNRIAGNKPEPEVFILAAKLPNILNEKCTVVEDT